VDRTIELNQKRMVELEDLGEMKLNSILEKDKTQLKDKNENE